jgi:hypothetical protein
MASLGVQARLVPVDPAHERDLAGLLDRQALALLGSDEAPDQGGIRWSAPEGEE